MYEYLLFDVDGTLFDTARGVTRSVQYALEKMGYPALPPETLRRFIGPPLVDGFMEYCGFSSEDAHRATAFYRERYSVKGMFEVEPYAGIEDLLRDLCRSGRTLAVATGKPLVYSGKILEKYGFDQYFSAIATPELDGRRGTKYELISCILEQLGIAREAYGRVVMIGDRHFDIVGAHEVGIAGIGVRYGFSEPGEFEAIGTEYIVDTVSELRRLLLGGDGE